MSPQIAKNKIEQLAEFLEDLQQYEKINFDEFQQDKHYIIERLLELLVIYASDILLGALSERKEEMPTTLRTTFLRAGELQIIPEELAQRLAQAAGLRNVLAHAYAKVDLHIVHESIGPALQDFSEFVQIMSHENGLIKPDHSE